MIATIIVLGVLIVIIDIVQKKIWAIRDKIKHESKAQRIQRKAGKKKR